MSFFKDSKGPEAQVIKIIEPLYKFTLTIFFTFAMTKLITKKPAEVNKKSSVHRSERSHHDSQIESSISASKVEISETVDDMETACDELTEQMVDEVEDISTVDKLEDLELAVEVDSQSPLEELANHLRRLIDVDDAKIAVLGMEVQAEFPTPILTSAEPEVLNLGDDMLLQEQMGTVEEHKPVVVTGKMVISLLGQESNVKQIMHNEYGAQAVINAID